MEKMTGTIRLLGRLCLIALALGMAGCGGVDFFPEFKRAATTPDPFSFTSQTGIVISTPVTSNAITVAGLTGATSPISVTGPTGSASKYSINGATATDVAGTVKNGDTVTVTQTSAANQGASNISTLTIGNVNGTFTTTTQFVGTPVFSATSIVNGIPQASATLTSVDTIPGTHVITIKDANNTGNAQFSIREATGVVVTDFTSNTLTVNPLNTRVIVVRNPSPTGNVTTLTIDGVNGFTINIPLL